MHDVADFDRFPPRLRAYLTELHGALADALAGQDDSRLLGVMHQLKHAPQTMSAIMAGVLADFTLRCSDELGAEHAAVLWAFRVGELIMTLTDKTPVSPTGEVFADPRFEQLIAEAPKMLDFLPPASEALQ